MKLKFVCDCTYDNKPFATLGEIKEIDDKGGHASRWIRRGFAVEIKDDPKPEAKQQFQKGSKNKKEIETVVETPVPFPKVEEDSATIDL